MKRLIREPLLHFLVLGAALFAAFSLINGKVNRTDQIRVSAGTIEHLATGFTRTWRRPPSAEELNGLVRDYVREEVYYREAKAMGLDQNDPIIRRRLQQKLEFISEDTAQAEPTDADLDELLKSQPDKFRIGRTYTFTHVYFNPEHWPDNLNTAANSALAELNDNKGAPELAALGDRFLLGNTFDEIPASEVSKLFGDEFASKLSEVSVSKWQGPIQSGYGLHLVLVERRSEGALPSLDEARETLQREWKEANRKQANDEFFQKLSGRYTIVIEPLPASSPIASNSAVTTR